MDFPNFGPSGALQAPTDAVFYLVSSDQRGRKYGRSNSNSSQNGGCAGVGRGPEIADRSRGEEERQQGRATGRQQAQQTEERRQDNRAEGGTQGTAGTGGRIGCHHTGTFQIRAGTEVALEGAVLAAQPAEVQASHLAMTDTAGERTEQNAEKQHPGQQATIWGKEGR